jgi:hypothetical protein
MPEAVSSIGTQCSSRAAAILQAESGGVETLPTDWEAHRYGRGGRLVELTTFVRARFADIYGVKVFSVSFWGQ